ncbi:TIGR00269 family protein [Methanobrevibacter curvatus]|uniref:tRNA 2-thiocytidine biosynthesis protein TtcA n=1 Tax=Methanobrevibacter curvatus TaxID=49547 RepID=A0A162FDV0_9EURY|nr:TIGR00269 family protein [Methanobrevibacter curvatus]KZX11565.1 tRNA 2-thiocytidine biosynthesis protein TtcA [Methanobrevibacter curvatus]
MESCSKCGNPKVIIHRKQSGQHLCKECFIENIRKKVLKTIRKENLINKGDKVLVALSGGKDSVTVLDILYDLYKCNIIKLVAVTIDEGIDGYRNDGVEIAKDFASNLKIEHHVVSFKEVYGMSLDEIMKNSKHRGSCTYCGVFRRDIINKMARKVNADKIVTGHNLDDETQAILMNYLEGNIRNLSKIGSKTESKSPMFITKIKPLREIPEKEIGLYAVAKDLNVHFASCPYAEKSFRGEISEIVKGLSKNHPTLMYSTLRGFDKIKTAINNQYKTKYKFERCKICGEPSSNELCRVCTFLDELK